MEVGYNIMFQFSYLTGTKNVGGKLFQRVTLLV